MQHPFEQQNIAAKVPIEDLRIRFNNYRSRIPVRGTTETLADAMRDLKTVFPNGHHDFIRITVDEIELHSKKNKDYAEGGDPLGNFRRTETIKRLYPGLDWASDYGGAVDYMLKQVDAVLWSLAHQKGTECESLVDKLRDISVYAKLIGIMLTERPNIKCNEQAIGPEKI